MMFANFDRTLSINRVSKSINDVFEQLWANWDIDNLAGM